VIEGHAIGTPTTTVMTGDEELLEAEMPHHRDLIPRHRTLRVWRMIESGRRLTAVAVAREIGSDHREVPREARGDLVPHHMCLRVAVKQQ